MLKVENITVTAGSKNILNDVSALFETGKMNLIVGPNGSGKSTLIKAVSKQMAVSSGKIFYGDQELHHLSYKQLSRFRAVLSQHTEIAFPLSVKEVVMMGRYPHFVSTPSKNDREVVEETMTYFDVSDMWDRNYLTLSGGEKQRVNFARVLAQIWLPVLNQPRYLLLDEPLTFLDVHYQYLFLRQLQSLITKNDLTVVGVVHDLNLAARFGNSVLILNEGKVAGHGKPRDVFTKEIIASVFQMEPEIHYTNSNAMYIHF
jgi:iron complex transport system ATP-binding protein